MRIEWNNISVPADLKLDLNRLADNFVEFMGEFYDNTPYLVCTSGDHNGLQGAHDRGIAVDLSYPSPSSPFWQRFPAHFLLFARHICNNTNYVVSLSWDAKHMHIQKEDPAALRFAGLNTEKYNGRTYDFENIEQSEAKKIAIAKHYMWSNIEVEKTSGSRTVLVLKYLTKQSNNSQVLILALLLLIFVLILGGKR